MEHFPKPYLRVSRWHLPNIISINPRSCQKWWQLSNFESPNLPPFPCAFGVQVVLPQISPENMTPLMRLMMGYINSAMSHIDKVLMFPSDYISNLSCLLGLQMYTQTKNQKLCHAPDCQSRGGLQNLNNFKKQGVRQDSVLFLHLALSHFPSLIWRPQYLAQVMPVSA